MVSTVVRQKGASLRNWLSSKKLCIELGVVFTTRLIGAPSLFSISALAIDIHRNRKADDEARKNPLPKLYHERKEDGNRNRHVTPNAAAEGKTPVRENVEEKAD